MKHHSQKVLHALFEHPISANIAWRDVEHLFTELGGAIDTRTGNRISVTLKGHTMAFHSAHHTLTKDDVSAVKTFLTDCGFNADSPAA